MILTQQKESQVYTDGESQGSIAMTLDTDSTQMLMQMMSKNLYSDEIGSPIRELASNGLDSHRRAGVDKPVVVSLVMNKDGNCEFTVEDFGVGLDASDVTNIISKYGKSLARQEAFSLGMMGLGFKSPLAYTSSFYFIARKNGIEHKYMMYEGEDGNRIDHLYEKKTTEGNGVKVILPVRYADRGAFVGKIKEQLAYFESVYFDVPSAGMYNGISNTFTIYRGDGYQCSALSKDSSLHLCLDNVYYPIDFQKLGIPRIDIPLALRCSLTDGIFPIPSRESIRYTPEAKKIILEKIGKIAEILVSKYNEGLTEAKDFNSIIQYYTNGQRSVTIANKIIDIVPLLRYSNIPIGKPTLEGVKLLDLERLVEIRDTFLGEYLVKYTSTRYKMKEVKGAGDSITLSTFNNNRGHYYIFSERIGGNKREYLKTLFGYDSAYIIKKVRSYTLKSDTTYSLTQKSYMSLLQLAKYPKETWRARIKEYQYLQSLYTKDFIDIDKITVPQDWLDSRKRQRISSSGGDGTRRVKLQGEVVAKVGCDLERAMGSRACKFVPETYKLEDIHKLPYLHIYTCHDDFLLLDDLYYIARQQKMRCLTFSPREIKNLEKYEIHNLMSYQKFMEGKNKLFKRIITAHLIEKLMKQFSSTFSQKSALETISAGLTLKLKDLQKYKEKNFINEHEVIYTAMLEVATEHNLFDPEIYDTYLEVKGLLEKLPFINVLMRTLDGGSYYNARVAKTEEMIPVLRDLFKYYKYRIDYTNYNLTFNDNSWMDEIIEEDLTEDTVEALVDPVVEDEEIETI